MADDDRPLTADDVARFLGRQGAKAECPKCGTNDWSLTESVLLVPPALVVPTEGRLDSSAKLLPTIPMACTNCGFIQLLARQVVEPGVRAMRAMRAAIAEQERLREPGSD